jgi:hypothetical protein
VNSDTLCNRCRHRHKTPTETRDVESGRYTLTTCDAFPEGIPVEISHRGFDHRTEYPGDLGTRFEPDGPIGQEWVRRATQRTETVTADLDTGTIRGETIQHINAVLGLVEQGLLLPMTLLDKRLVNRLAVAVEYLSSLDDAEPVESPFGNFSGYAGEPGGGGLRPTIASRSVVGYVLNDHNGSQLELIRSRCEEAGAELGLIEADESSLPMVLAGRPGLHRALQEFLSAPSDVFLTASLQIFDTDLTQVLRLIAKTSFGRRSLVSVGDNFDTGTLGGRAAAAIIREVLELEDDQEQRRRREFDLRTLRLRHRFGGEDGILDHLIRGGTLEDDE